MGFFGRKRAEARRAQAKQFEHDINMVEMGYTQNKEMSLTEYNRNRKTIKQQNRYNTPENQMKRFEEAGLNPNLMYGQGSHGNQTETAKYQAPTVDYSEVANPELGANQVWGQSQDNLKNYLDISAQILDIGMQGAGLHQMQTVTNPNIRSQTDLQDQTTEVKRLDKHLLKNLHGLEDDNSPLGKQATKYNEQTQLKRDAEIEQLQNKAKIDYLQRELQRGDLDVQTRKIYQSWLDQAIKVGAIFFGK